MLCFLSRVSTLARDIDISIIYTSLFHQRNGSSKNTYNIINKENTISKYKVNMTIISLVKNMTIKLQSILKWFTSTHKFFIFSRNFPVRLSKKTLGSSKPNMCWQVLTMLMSKVFSNFMNSLFTYMSRLSIRPLLSSILCKRLNILSYLLHHSSFINIKNLREIPTRSPPTGR